MERTKELQEKVELLNEIPLNRKQMAKRLGVCVRTLDTMTITGVIPSVKRGGKRLYYISQVAKCEAIW